MESNPMLEMMRMVTDQAKTHEKNVDVECVGLPFCAACRAVVLIRHHFNIEQAEKFINNQPEGTKLYL